MHTETRPKSHLFTPLGWVLWLWNTTWDGIRGRSIGARLGLVVGLGTLGLLAGALILVSVQASRALQTQAQGELTTAVDIGERMLQVYDSTLIESTQRLYQTFLSFLPEGELRLDVAQRVQVGAYTPPAVYVGDTRLNGELALVDRFTRATGGVATVFVRDGEDFIRVTTSLTRQDGVRAMGTALDRSHPAYLRLLAGQDYMGPATLFGEEYITYYGAVSAADGQTQAVFFIGLPYGTGLRALRDTLRATRVGQQG